MCNSQARSQNMEWTRAFPFIPKDNLISHPHLNASKFYPSYDKNGNITCMGYLMGWEYGRVWLKEFKKFHKSRAVNSKRKFIQPPPYKRLNLNKDESKRFIMKKFVNVPSRVYPKPDKKYFKKDINYGLQCK